VRDKLALFSSSSSQNFNGGGAQEDVVKSKGEQVEVSDRGHFHFMGRRGRRRARRRISSTESRTTTSEGREDRRGKKGEGEAS